MVHSNFRLKAVMVASVLALATGCSHSSTVSENNDMTALPVETADQAPGPTTDVVPDPGTAAAPAPEDPNLASQAPMPPAADPLTTSSYEAAPVADTQAQSDPFSGGASAGATGGMGGGAVGGTAYVVKKGDTLMKIAFEQYGDLYKWKEIYESNRSAIQDPSHLAAGTQLTLNGAGGVSIDRDGEKYLIKHGDTLGSISNEVYGTPKKWKKLWKNNSQLIKDPNRIYAGFYLYYQSEGRLTHDQNPVPLMDGPDAAVKPAVTDPRAPASK